MKAGGITTRAVVSRGASGSRPPPFEIGDPPVATYIQYCI